MDSSLGTVTKPLEQPLRTRPGRTARVGSCRRGVLAWSCVVALFAWAEHALARDAIEVLVLAPAQIDDAAQWSDVVRGLHAAGARALQVGELAIDPVYAACRASECAAQLAISTRLAVALFVFTPETAPGAPGVELQLFEPDGTRLTQQAMLGSRSRADVVADLVKTARERVTLVDQALLSVTARPVGGVVWIDGRSAGVTPFQQPMAAGTHSVRVTLPGFRPQTRQVELARGEVRLLDVRLTRAAELPVASEHVRPASAARAVSPLNFVLGGALALLALPALVASINTLVNDGQCLESTGRGCSERASFGARSGLLLAAGGVALAGGGYLLIARPFELVAEASPRSAQLELRARF
jgi:hypothetical protein